MKLAVLAKADGWHFLDLCRAAGERHELVPLNFSELGSSVSSDATSCFTDTKDFEEFDCVFVRAMSAGSLQQVVFRMDLLQQVFLSGIPVVNPPKTIEASVDKYLSLAQLQKRAIPVPPTRVVQSFAGVERSFAELGNDVVFKPIFGSQGKGLRRFNRLQDLAEAADQLQEQGGGVFYLQKFIETGNKDFRLLVVGGKVFSMARENRNNWITNVNLGGTSRPHDATEQEREIAIKAAKAVGGSVIGVDLAYDPSGSPFVLEVNSSPGWEAISKSLEVDIASEILDWLETKSRSTAHVC